MSAFDDLVKMVVELQRRLAVMERDIARNKIGAISDVDPEKGYRVQFGEDDQGNPKKSSWLPHPEHGGASKTWNPLSVGQVVMVMSPPGDPRKAVLIRAGYTDEHGAPSQSLDERVFEFGAAKILVKEDRIVLSVGRSVLTITDKDIDYKARRHYLRGKVAAGLNYSDNVKEFPSQAMLVSGNAKNLFSKINGDDIPDDD